MNLLIANIGVRDIALDVGVEGNPRYFHFGPEYKSREAVCEFLAPQDGTAFGPCGARTIAQYLLERFDTYRERLRLPILEPTLTQVFDTLGVTGRLDRLILISTDQPQTAGDHRLSDTIHCAQMVERLLVRSSFQSKIENIEHIRIECNPSSHDVVYRCVADALGQRLGTGITPWDQVFVATRGGTPAMTYAPRQFALDRFGPRVVLIEVDEPSAAQQQAGVSGRARAVDTWPFRKYALIRTALELLERYDYSGVRALLDEQGLSSSTLTTLDRLLHLLQARLNMDFDGADAALHSLGQGLRERVPPLFRIVPRSALGREHLAELTWNSHIVFERGDFTGFVTRATSLREAVLRYLTRELAGLTLSGTYLTKQDVRAPELASYLEMQVQEGRIRVTPGGYRINSSLLGTIVGWLSDHHANSATRNILTYLAPTLTSSLLREFEKLRHGVVHQAKGISERDIDVTLRRVREQWQKPSSIDAFMAMAESWLIGLTRLLQPSVAPDHGVAEVRNAYRATHELIRELLETL